MLYATGYLYLVTERQFFFVQGNNSVDLGFKFSDSTQSLQEIYVTQIVHLSHCRKINNYNNFIIYYANKSAGITVIEM